MLLFGADVVGEGGQGAGGVAGDGAGCGTADAGVAGLGAVVAQQGVFGCGQGAGRRGIFTGGGVGAGVGDVEEPENARSQAALSCGRIALAGSTTAPSVRATCTRWWFL